MFCWGAGLLPERPRERLPLLCLIASLCCYLVSVLRLLPPMIIPTDPLRALERRLCSRRRLHPAILVLDDFERAGPKTPALLSMGTLLIPEAFSNIKIDLSRLYRQKTRPGSVFGRKGPETAGPRWH